MSPKLPQLLTCRPLLTLLGLAVLSCAADAQAGSKAEGARLFASSGCTHCHGAMGEGTDSGPSLRDVRHKLKAAEIQQQIVNGGGAMPAFGAALDPEQVKALVAMLRAKTWVTAPPDSPPLPAIK